MKYPETRRFEAKPAVVVFSNLAEDDVAMTERMNGLTRKANDLVREFQGKARCCRMRCRQKEVELMLHMVSRSWWMEGDGGSGC